MKTQVRITPDGLFKGDLTDGTIERIRKIRSMDCVPVFKNEIYDFPHTLRKKAQCNNVSAYEYALNLGVLEKYIGELRDYQTVGAAFLYASPRSMLGDAAGIGKTPQFCAMLNRLRKFGYTQRTLVAAETTAVGQIAAEIERFTGLRVTVLSSRSVKMKRQTSRFYLTHKLDNTEPTKDSIDFDVLVVTHSTLRSDTFYTWLSRVVHGFGTFILDESYVVKNPDTAISGYVKILCSKIPRVHFLNATVFENRLLDVINQFNLLYPGLLPAKSWVERKFCKYKKVTFPKRGGKGELGSAWELVSYKNQDVFRKALSLVYLTRKKKDVKASKTERFYQTYLIQQTKQQKEAIRQGYRYFEVLNCPSLCMGLDIKNDLQGLPKLNRLVELVREDFEEQNIVIYAWHIEIQDAIKENLEKLGRKVAILNGSTKNRDEIREDFNDGVYDVMVTNAKRSLNLYSGDVCIFYSVETNPANVEQIAGRIDRNIDDSSKTFVLLAYEGAEANFFINTVRQRSVDSADLTDVASETVLKFGEHLSEIITA